MYARVGSSPILRITKRLIINRFLYIIPIVRRGGGTADALASGASGGDPVEVQILSTAPKIQSKLRLRFFILSRWLELWLQPFCLLKNAEYGTM